VSATHRWKSDAAHGISHKIERSLSAVAGFPSSSSSTGTSEYRRSVGIVRKRSGRAAACCCMHACMHATRRGSNKEPVCFFLSLSWMESNHSFTASTAAIPTRIWQSVVCLACCYSRENECLQYSCSCTSCARHMSDGPCQLLGRHAHSASRAVVVFVVVVRAVGRPQRYRPTRVERSSSTQLTDPNPRRPLLEIPQQLQLLLLLLLLWHALSCRLGMFEPAPPRCSPEMHAAARLACFLGFLFSFCLLSLLATAPRRSLATALLLWLCFTLRLLLSSPSRRRPL